MTPADVSGWPYTIALIFGALTLVFHSWENFNRRSDEAWHSLGDLVTLLNPSDMRARQVYWRAFTFYAAILVLVYLVICAYAGFFAPLLGEEFAALVRSADPAAAPAGAPVTAVGAEALPASGYDPALRNAAPAADLTPPEPAQDRRNPALPLALSLAMVGLAPQIPVLRTFETRLRYAAHWLSGIPTRLVKGADLLSRQSFGLKDAVLAYDGPPVDNPMLVSRQDWLRLQHCLRWLGRKDVPIDTYDIAERIGQIIAFRAWILQGRVDARNLYTSFRADEVEAAIARQVDRFLVQLDQATGFLPGAPDTRAPDPDGALWARLDEEAGLLVRKLSLLMMLYVEHGVLDVDEEVDLPLRPVPVVADHGRQREEIRAFLRRRLTHAREQSDWGELSFTVWGRAIASVLLLATLAGALAGVLAVSTRGGAGAGEGFRLGVIRTALDYGVNAAVIYALPLFAAFSIRQNRALNNQWKNPFAEPWVRWSFQLAEVFVISAVVAAFCAVSQNVAATIGAVGIERVVQNWGSVLRLAAEYSGALSLVGPVLAMTLVLLIDAWDAPHRLEEPGKDTGPHTLARMNRVILWGCGLGVGLTAFVTRVVASYVNEAALIRFNAQASLSPLPDLLLRNWPTYLTTTAVAVCIGLVAGFTVRETLTKEFDTGAVRRARPSRRPARRASGEMLK